MRPALGTGVETDFIRGMGKVGTGVKILLDVDRVVAPPDVESLESVEAAALEGETAP